MYYLSNCTSTNDAIQPYIKMNYPSPIALYTFHQTKGRGQYGNAWENSKNENLALSLSYPIETFHISKVFFNYCTAIVLRDFLDNMSDDEVKIKWPNDIIIKNKKVAGILIENKIINGHHVYVIGIGLNVLQKKFNHLPNAGSLYTQIGKEFNLHSIAKEISDYFYENLINVTNNNSVLSLFNSYLYRRNTISVFSKDGMRQNGIIKHANEEGRLIVELENEGIKSFFHKEIELLY